MNNDMHTQENDNLQRQPWHTPEVQKIEMTDTKAGVKATTGVIEDSYVTWAHMS